MKKEALREALVYQAEGAFFALMQQVDVLFDLTGFYLDRYPPGGASDAFKARELKETVDNLAALSSQLAEVIKGWKHGDVRSASRRVIVELSILNELWANAQALVYFLLSHDISLDDFNLTISTGCFQVLVKCNRLL